MQQNKCNFCRTFDRRRYCSVCQDASQYDGNSGGRETIDQSASRLIDDVMTPTNEMR